MEEKLIAPCGMNCAVCVSFLKAEGEKWRCAECGGVVCCHIGLCLGCQLETLKNNRKYRWG